MVNLLTDPHFYFNNVSKFVTEQDRKEFIKAIVPHIVSFLGRNIIVTLVITTILGDASGDVECGSMRKGA